MESDGYKIIDRRKTSENYEGEVCRVCASPFFPPPKPTEVPFRESIRDALEAFKTMSISREAVETKINELIEHELWKEHNWYVAPHSQVLPFKMVVTA